MLSKIDRMKKYISLCLFMLFVSANYAQTIWQSDLQRVDKSGYYNIELNQKVIAHSLNIDLTDVKVLDKNKKEVPYFLRPVSPVREITRFENYTLKENSTKDSLNFIIVDNAKQEDINRFYIVVHRADVSKYAAVRGSNDLKQWYIVKQKTGISNLGYKKDDKEDVLVLDVPQGNYKYYEITIENNQASPLEILKVGKIENSSIYAQFTEIDLGSFVQKDSTNKKSYVNYPKLSEIYKINKLEFIVNSKANYLRNVSVVDTISGYRTRFALSSKSDNLFFLNNASFGKHTVIEIENNNNPPLTIDSIKVYGLNRYLCAYLEEGQKYYLEIGVLDNVPPKYDIEHFQDDIPVDLPVLKTDGLRAIEIKKEAPHSRELSLIEQPVFLWSVIVVIGLFLTFICVKMLKEMKKKK